MDFCYGIKCRAKDKSTVRNEREQAVITSFILGYPDVKYKRTVNRNTAKFEVR